MLRQKRQSAPPPKLTFEFMRLKLKYKIVTSQGCDDAIYESTFTKIVFNKLCFADMGITLRSKFIISLCEMVLNTIYIWNRIRNKIKTS